MISRTTLNVLTMTVVSYYASYVLGATSMTTPILAAFMVKERGYLKEGDFADLTVFDEEKVRNGIPDQEKSFGIEKVFINGQLVLDDDKLDEKALKNTGRAIPVL